MQDNFYLADNPNFPLEKATDWIARWKGAGGGFYFHPQPDGSVMVQLAAVVGPGGEDPNLDERAPIQAELLHDPELKSAVTTLAAQAWKRASDANALLAATLAEPKGHA